MVSRVDEGNRVFVERVAESVEYAVSCAVVAAMGYVGMYYGAAQFSQGNEFEGLAIEAISFPIASWMSACTAIFCNRLFTSFSAVTPD
ncbi:MAG: hypothetical protein P0S94_00670 [Simkaniaceae bacterium]|nr:hypothetical protein [Simkaniaceae bacterium]